MLRALGGKWEQAGDLILELRMYILFLVCLWARMWLEF